MSDGELSDSETPINVLPVNDAPLLAEIANSEVGEDGLFALALDVTDIDSEDLFTVCQLITMLVHMF